MRYIFCTLTALAFTLNAGAQMHAVPALYTPSYTVTPKKSSDPNYFRHRVSWVATDVLALRLLFAYEHINKSGKLGLRIPFGVGLGTYIFSWERPGVTTVTGFELNIYPKTAHGMFSYYYGPVLRVGYAGTDIHRGDKSVFSGLMLNNGINLNLSSGLFFNMYLGAGVKYAYYFNPESSPEPYSKWYPNVMFGIAVGLNIRGERE